MKRPLLSLASVALVLVGWEVASRSLTATIALFPPPSQVVLSLVRFATDGTLFLDLGGSLWRLAAGLSIGACVGVVTGLATGRVKAVRAFLSPIIQALRPLPPVAIIPLVIVWFGIGDGAKIFSIAFAVFFPVWINAHIGVTQISKTFLWSAALLTRSRIKIFRKVIFPAALPFIVTGIRTGIAIGFVMVFVSELAGASSGLGYRISVSQLAYRIDDMMAALVVLGFLGALTDAVFTFLVRKKFPWTALEKHEPAY